MSPTSNRANSTCHTWDNINEYNNEYNNTNYTDYNSPINCKSPRKSSVRFSPIDDSPQNSINSGEINEIVSENNSENDSWESNFAAKIQNIQQQSLNILPDFKNSPINNSPIIKSINNYYSNNITEESNINYKNIQLLNPQYKNTLGNDYNRINNNIDKDIDNRINNNISHISNDYDNYKIDNKIDSKIELSIPSKAVGKGIYLSIYLLIYLSY
jgi:hypothetical protein